MRRLLNDVGSIILALSLAVIVWMVAVNEENPTTRGTWPESISVEIMNQPQNTLIVGDAPSQVRLTLSAPQSSWENLRRESFRAWIDLSQAPLGMNQVEVQVECSDKDELRPSSAAVRLENLKQVELPVRVDVLDTPPFGFETKTEEVAATPALVQVSGQEQLVDQVSEVVADFYLRGANETTERKVVLQARDSHGDAVAVTLKPDTVLIKVPVVQRRGFRNLSIRVVWEGQPASGYRISNVSVDPTIVTAIGDPEVIQNIPGYLETAPVKVDGATGDVIERVALALPESVSILGTQAVQVSISVTPIESSLTVQREVTIQGLALNLNAVPSPLVVDVILSGPLPKLDSLRPEDVQVILDLFGLEAGSFQVAPIVIPPEGITVESVVPEKVQVQIETRPAVTGTPSITPTGRAGAAGLATATPAPTTRTNTAELHASPLELEEPHPQARRLAGAAWIARMPVVDYSTRHP